MITGRAFIRDFGKTPDGRPLKGILIIAAGDDLNDLPGEHLYDLVGDLKSILHSKQDIKERVRGMTFDNIAQEPIWIY
jgi:hypothetical protein